jgi:hypothetical protein
MGLMVLIVSGSVLILAVLSILFPPVSIWIGGLIGVVVFFGVGNFIAKSIK